MPRSQTSDPSAEDTVVRDYGGQPKVIAAGKRYWSKTSEAVFLRTLAQTCNVTAAARATGFGTDTAYDQRRKSEAFAARWRAALAIGYERLEEALLQSAIDSLSDVAPVPEAALPRMTVSEALHLLRLHQAEVKQGGRGKGRPRRPPSLDDVRASIVRKLEAIERARERG